MMADESEDNTFIDFDHERGKENLNENYTNNYNDADDEIDSELEEINIRVREIEKEAEKLKEIQSKVDNQLNFLPSSSASSLLSEKFPMNEMMAFQSHDKEEIDSRSIYVGNVDYGASAEELEKHFHQCGMINRVTILCNKVDGHSKGFAYIEFSSKEFVEYALKMNETMFHGRQIRVMAKRTNRPGYSRIKNFIPKRYAVHINRNVYGSFGILKNGYSNICGPFKHSKWSLKAGYDFSKRHFPY